MQPNRQFVNKIGDPWSGAVVNYCGPGHLSAESSFYHSRPQLLQVTIFFRSARLAGSDALVLSKWTGQHVGNEFWRKVDLQEVGWWTTALDQGCRIFCLGGTTCYFVVPCEFLEVSNTTLHFDEHSFKKTTNNLSYTNREFSQPIQIHLQPTFISLFYPKLTLWKQTHETQKSFI